MKDNYNYIRTDLAVECREAETKQDQSGIEYNETEENGVQISTLGILNEEGVKVIGKPVGTYVTITIGKIWLDDEKKISDTTDILSREIKKLASSMVDNIQSVLVIGLGNRAVTPDALGPQSVDGLVITRHIKEYDQNLFNSMGYGELSALTPGVVGQTGIETFELIEGAVKNVNPSLVVVIDALASRSVDRLACTIQLTDSGISPGSGIGNKRKMIDKASLGVPVLVIGAPTVVDSSTLVYDALEKAGIEDINEDLKQVLENGRSFFVTIKESDVAISELSKMISNAVNMAFSK